MCFVLFAILTYVCRTLLGLDEDSSQKLAAEMKQDGAAYRLLVEKREEIAKKLSSERNDYVLEWAEAQTFTRFIGITNFINKIKQAANAKPIEKPGASPLLLNSV